MNAENGDDKDGQASEWERYSDDFRRDGSLRDIYVINTSLADWARVLRFLSEGPLRTRLVPGDTAHAMTAHEIFSRRQIEPVRLDVSLHGIELCCHFFITTEIELDFWPDEVTRENFRALLTFLCELGRRTGKAAVITHENDPENPLFQYDPACDRVTHARTRSIAM